MEAAGVENSRRGLVSLEVEAVQKIVMLVLMGPTG